MIIIYHIFSSILVEVLIKLLISPHSHLLPFISKATFLQFGGVPWHRIHFTEPFCWAGLNLGLCELLGPPTGPQPQDTGMYLRTTSHSRPLSQWKFQSCGYNLVSSSAVLCLLLPFSRWVDGTQGVGRMSRRCCCCCRRYHCCNVDLFSSQFGVGCVTVIRVGDVLLAEGWNRNEREGDKWCLSVQTMALYWCVFEVH